MNAWRARVWSVCLIAAALVAAVGVHGAAQPVDIRMVEPGDITPPATTILVTPAAADGLAGWYVTAPSITLSADETASIAYSFSDVFSEYTGAFVAPEGESTLSYYAVDLSDNRETTKTADFKVDLTNPTAPIGVSATALGTTSVRVSWTAATDSESGIWQYVVYDGATDLAVATVSGISADITALDPSTAYAFYVRAQDVAGRESEASGSASATTLTPDTAPPSTAITVNPAAPDGPGGWYLTAPYVTLSASEPASIYYSFSDVFAIYSGSIPVPEGAWTLSYYAVDLADNREVTRTRSFAVDLTSPDASSDMTATALGTTSIRLSWRAPTDVGSGVWRYHVYNAATDALVTTTFSSTADIAGLTQGTTYSYYVKAEDRAGRTGAASAIASVTTLMPDTAPPVTTLGVVPAAPDGESGWYVTAPTVTLTPSEVGTTYSSLGGAFTPYTAPFALPAGQLTLSYYSIDLDSNQEVTLTAAFKIDLTDPTAPTGGTAVAQSTTAIRLSWRASTDTGSGMWRYRIYNAATDAQLGTVVGAGADISNLIPATQYTFYVRAQDGAGRLSAPSATFSATTQAPVSGLTPTYRFYNVRNGAHFYTSSAAERDTVLSTWPDIFTYEGIAFYTNPASNTQPLYRFYNRVSASHFYTASAEERDIVIATWPHVFTYEGPVSVVSTAPAPGATTVYRFYNRVVGSHFYTASAEERDLVITRWPNVYLYEGPAYWLVP